MATTTTTTNRCIIGSISMQDASPQWGVFDKKCQTKSVQKYQHGVGWDVRTHQYVCSLCAAHTHTRSIRQGLEINTMCVYIYIYINMQITP